MHEAFYHASESTHIYSTRGVDRFVFLCIPLKSENTELDNYQRSSAFKDVDTFGTCQKPVSSSLWSIPAHHF